jgi:hypothetical protein
MSDPDHDAVEWAESDRFVMPVIPDHLRVDPCTLALLHCVSFLELSGDKTVDPDWAVEAMEHVAHYLQRLSPATTARLKTDLETIASYAESQQLAPPFVDLARRFTEYAGLDDETQSA